MIEGSTPAAPRTSPSSTSTVSPAAPTEFPALLKRTFTFHPSRFTGSFLPSCSSLCLNFRHLRLQIGVGAAPQIHEPAILLGGLAPLPPWPRRARPAGGGPAARRRESCSGCGSGVVRNRSK